MGEGLSACGGGLGGGKGFGDFSLFLYPPHVDLYAVLQRISILPQY